MMKANALTTSLDTAHAGAIGMHWTAVTKSTLLVEFDATGNSDSQTPHLGSVAMTTQGFYS